MIKAGRPVRQDSQPSPAGYASGSNRWTNLLADLKSFFSGEVRADAPRFDPPLEEWKPPALGDRIGICCSGGGVRSASYNLGALQAMQEEGVLEAADYLATVSGGGYIGGAMTMVACSPNQDLVWGNRPRPFARMTPEEKYLRNRSSYLAPTLALKLKMITRVLLGFVINAAFIGSFLVLAGRAFGYLAAYLRPNLIRGNADAEALEVWSGWTGIALSAGAALLAVGLGLVFLTILRRLPLARETTMVRISKRAIGLSAALLVALLAVPWAIGASRSAVTHDLPLVDQPVAEVVEDVKNGTSDRIDASKDEVAVVAAEEQQTKGKSALQRLYGVLAALGVPTLLAGASLAVLKKQASMVALIAAGVVAPLLIVFGFLVAANDAAWAGIGAWSGPDWYFQALWVVVPLAIIAVLYVASDLTATSLHPFYKRRLSTAFALQRVPSSEPPPRDIATEERPYDLNVPLYEMVPSGGPWPTHIVCAAANISDEARTPPGRRSVAFTFEPDRVGGPEVGYIPTKYFAQVLGTSRAEDITLPAAVAISGAALSPSMGAMTKPTLTFLLALLNARLGVWLPNPRLAIDRHLREVQTMAMADSAAGGAQPAGPGEQGTDVFELKPWRRPKPRFSWLWKEMRGKNSAHGRFLYVTDGGHWENLGLVELLRRGCTKIYCFDAAGDKEQTFFTIGEAMALARSELGVEFDLSPDVMRPEEDESYSAADHVYGTFRYRNEDGTPGREGRIVFAKAAVTADAPWDVRAYKERDPAFPNHSLLAQMFADKTFESYRKLGHFTGKRAVATMESPPAPPGGNEADPELEEDEAFIAIVTPIDLTTE